MITTEIYRGQGLGNQLACYIATRVIAKDKNFEFGIKSPENFKCLDFLELDFGGKVLGGNGPEGGTPRALPEGIKYYYNERKLVHGNGTDIRTYDENLVGIPDNTKIDGIMQDEQYIIHRKEEICNWLKIKPGKNRTDFSNEKTCVINFRGGEYVGIKEVFLPKKYWIDAMSHMRTRNPEMEFVVVTDDVKTAKKFFPYLKISHDSIGSDYSIIQNAHYLIISNSSFAFFPAWLNEKVKLVIAPKYWARHNISDGYWACSYNITLGWMYQDRDGKLYDYNSCINEFNEYKKKNASLFSQTKVNENFLVVSNYYNDLSWLPEYTDKYLVYDQSEQEIYPPKLDTNKVVKSAHLGHNIRDYCSYIIEHYDTLPERVAFLTGNIFPRHINRDCFDKLINNTTLTPLIDRRKHKTRWPISFFSQNGLYNEINNSWYLNKSHPTKYFHNYNDFLQFCFDNPKIPKHIPFAPGANYIVPRGNILKYPKIFYENLRTFVSHSSTAIPGESHIIERAFYSIWMGTYEINEKMLSPIGNDFRPTLKEKYSLWTKFTLFVINRLWDIYYIIPKMIKRILK
jgi:hypothetical protein